MAKRPVGVAAMVALAAVMLFATASADRPEETRCVSGSWQTSVACCVGQGGCATRYRGMVGDEPLDMWLYRDGGLLVGGHGEVWKDDAPHMEGYVEGNGFVLYELYGPAPDTIWEGTFAADGALEGVYRSGGETTRFSARAAAKPMEVEIDPDVSVLLTPLASGRGDCLTLVVNGAPIPMRGAFCLKGGHTPSGLRPDATVRRLSGEPGLIHVQWSTFPMGRDRSPGEALAVFTADPKGVLVYESGVCADRGAGPKSRLRYYNSVAYADGELTIRECTETALADMNNVEGHFENLGFELACDTRVFKAEDGKMVLDSHDEDTRVKRLGRDTMLPDGYGTGPPPRGR
ncbi:MAG: hypothetical protein ACLFOY_09320 [Desulfatibacillaceae bacterium]